MPLPVASTDWETPPLLPSAGPPVPDPGLLDTISAGFKAARADTLGHSQTAEMDAYRPVVDALRDLGHDPEQFIWHSEYSSAGGTWDREAIYRAVQSEKAKGHLKNLPDTLDQFEAQWRARDRQQTETAQQTAARGNGIAGFLGGVAGSMTDPINLATLPFGGVGKTVLRRLASEAALNMGIEAIEQPLIDSERRQQGRTELTLPESAMNIAMAGVGAATLRGAGEGIPKALSGARGVFERTVAANWERLPQGLRERWTAALPQADTPAHDILVADTVDAIAGDTPPEHVAAGSAVLRREAQLQQASPFASNGAGSALHPELLADAMRRVLADVPDTAPVAPGRAALARSTGIASGSVPGDAESRFMARVRRTESGGNDAAANPRSSASGRYQFTDGTWLGYFKRRFPDSGLSDAQILQRKTNGALQDTLMADMTRDNAAFLRSQGEAVSEGNLYLVHFAGQGGARKLFEADPGASVENVLGRRVVDANPQLAGKSVQEAIDWAHRAIGASPEARAGARVEVRNDVPEADALQAEIDRVSAQLAELDSSRPTASLLEDGTRPTASLLEDGAPARPAPTSDPATIAQPIDDPALQGPAPEPKPFDMGNPPAEVSAILPQLGDVARDPSRSLNNTAAIARDLGVAESDVRRGLNVLAARGDITMVSNPASKRYGQFMRKPPRGEPVELRDFLASIGGVRDNEGHFLGLKGDRARNKRSGSRDLQRMTPWGPLLRNKGLALDKAREAAEERGFLPIGSTTADLLNLIEESARGRPVYPVGDAPAPDPMAAHYAPEPGDPDWMAAEHVAREELRTLGFEADPHPEIMDELTRLLLDRPAGMSDGDAIYYAINQMAERNQAEAFAYGAEGAYDPIDYGTATGPDAGFPTGREAPPAGEDSARWEPAGADAQAGGFRGDGDSRAAGAQLAELPPAERAPFLDPDSSDTKAQADSLVHDARVTLELNDALDPAVAARQAEEARLRAEAPLRGENATGQAQDGAMGLALFDMHDQPPIASLLEAGDQPQFRLDAEQEGKSLPEIMDDLDAEATDLKNIRDCL